MFWSTGRIFGFDDVPFLLRLKHKVQRRPTRNRPRKASGVLSPSSVVLSDDGVVSAATGSYPKRVARDLTALDGAGES